MRAFEFQFGPPLAAGDAFSLDGDAVLNVPAPGVLGNDTSQSGGPLTAVPFIGPTNGALTRNGYGSFSYTPNPDFNGEDSLLYQVSNGPDTDRGTVTLTVNGVNDVPKANDDSATTPLNSRVIVNILANDQDLNGDALSATAVTSPAAAATPPNFKVAFIADQGISNSAEAVLQLIKAELADMVLVQGDLGYGIETDPQTAMNWEDQTNRILGPNFPLFASIGNHDSGNWSIYQQLLIDRLDRITGATCTGTYGENSACTYQGLFFILSGGGERGTELENSNYIGDELSKDDSIWSICSWHHNQRVMQVGGKRSSVGWGPYEECRKGGAIIATGHEHSYHRTKTLSSTEFQTVDPLWPSPDLLRVGNGSTFVLVSGLGGRSIRDQERCLPTVPPYGCKGEWAHIYTTDQGAIEGLLFIEFNVEGDPKKAKGYFKNIEGAIIDSFTIISDHDSAAPPPPAAIASIPLRINVGGGPATDTQGNAWLGDHVYDPTEGWGYLDLNGDSGSIDRKLSDPSLDIAGTLDDDIFTTERWNMDSYRIDLPDGDYDLHLGFAETWSGITGPNQRVFDVIVEGTKVLAGLDVFKEVGFNTAVVKTIAGVAITDGQLNIEFAPGVENPMINGIEVAEAIDVFCQLGDTNVDGATNALDITAIELIVVGALVGTPCADANEDGNTNAVDITATEILVAMSP